MWPGHDKAMIDQITWHISPQYPVTQEAMVYSEHRSLAWPTELAGRSWLVGRKVGLPLMHS